MSRHSQAEAHGRFEGHLRCSLPCKKSAVLQERGTALCWNAKWPMLLREWEGTPGRVGVGCRAVTSGPTSTTQVSCGLGLKGVWLSIRSSATSQSLAVMSSKALRSVVSFWQLPFLLICISAQPMPSNQGLDLTLRLQSMPSMDWLQHHLDWGPLHKEASRWHWGPLPC